MKNGCPIRKTGAPGDPVRRSYTFTGWSEDFSEITSDLTVIAEYEINVYTVIFEDWDESILKTEQVEHGDAATAPDDPERNDYTFTGWSEDFSEVTSPLTITATYESIYTGGIGASIDNDTGMTLYPNPAIDYVNVSVDGLVKNAVVNIINLNGMIIIRETMNNTNELMINTTSLPEGVYIVRVVCDSGKASYSKLIIE